MDKKTRTFDDGRLIVKFHTEQEAKEFDQYLNSEIVIEIDGTEYRSKIADDFNPYQFFGFETETVLGKDYFD